MGDYGVVYKTHIMRKGLAQIIGLALCILFIVGAILVPTYHEAHCKDHAAAAGDTHCPICQVRNTPCITPLSLNTLSIGQTVVGSVRLESPVFVSSPLRSPSQARAPPAG